MLRLGGAERDYPGHVPQGTVARDDPAKVDATIDGPVAQNGAADGVGSGRRVSGGLGGAGREIGGLLAGSESVSHSGMSEACSPANDEGGAASDAGGPAPGGVPVAGTASGEGTMAGGALDDTYRRHWPDLCRYVLRSFGPGPPDPEDIAQQAFVRLSGASSVVENIGSFLRKTARNLVIDHYRGSLRTSLVLRDVTILDGENADYTPEDVLASKEHLLLLNAAIDNLRPKERVALLMHRIDGASFTDIAAHLGVSHSGARLLVSRAFERCAAAVGDAIDMGGRP